MKLLKRRMEIRNSRYSWCYFDMKNKGDMLWQKHEKFARNPRNLLHCHIKKRRDVTQIKATGEVAFCNGRIKDYTDWGYIHYRLELRILKTQYSQLFFTV